MDDFDETVAMKHELAGDKLATCELCRRPVAAASLIAVTGSAPLGEPDDLLSLCADCRQRIAAGEITFEDAVAAGLEEADEEASR